MGTNGHSYNGPHLLIGLAGETAPGYEMSSGLYRLSQEDENWELSESGLPPAPEVRVITPHPSRPGTVYAGTQDGPYVSANYGQSWTKMTGVETGLPVWSILFDPGDDQTIYTGGEEAQVHASADGGTTWTCLSTDMRFPEITLRPGANPAKRILMMGASPFDQEVIYGAIEVGGVMRSVDGGRTWENLSHGMYQDDQPVDTHGILASSVKPGLVFSITGAGLFRSSDAGDHWSHVPLPPLDETGRLYTRAIHESPDNPSVVWVGAGNGFDGNLGGLFKSEDGGDSWARVDMGLQPPSSVFCIAIHRDKPELMACAAYRGQVYVSENGGESWQMRSLPEGATQVYALAWS